MVKPPTPSEVIAQLMRFIAEKAKNVKSPMSIQQLARQFKEESGSLMAVDSLAARIRNHRHKIHKMRKFDTNTKVRMMFALSAPIDDGFLKKLKEHADVRVDEKGRITKFKANDGNLELNGSHGLSSRQKSMHSDRWKKVCQKAIDDESDEEDDEDANGERDYEKNRAGLVKFLIERTKNANCPLSIHQLATDYIEEFKTSESQSCICARIIRFFPRIHKMDQFDMSTKVKMLFALSVPIDARFLNELQTDAFVELDERLKIKKYEAKDGSMKLERVPCRWERLKATRANKNKSQVVNDSSESEEEDDERKDSSETDGNDEEGDGETSGEEPSEEGDDEESVPSDEDSSMENGGDPMHFDYEPPQNHPEVEDVGNTLPVEQKPRIEDEIPQDNNPDEEQDDVMVLQPAPVEQKPQGLLRMSGPVGEEPTTSIKELLMLLRGPVMAIRSPSLERICAKFNTKIQELANGNQQMLVESLHIPLDSCLFLLLKHAAPKCPPEVEATSLKNFLLTLQANTCHIDHPSMASFHQKLQTKISELSARDEEIPIHIIDRAMDNTLHMLDA